MDHPGILFQNHFQIRSSLGSSPGAFLDPLLLGNGGQINSAGVLNLRPASPHVLDWGRLAPGNRKIEEHPVGIERIIHNSLANGRGGGGAEADSPTTADHGHVHKNHPFRIPIAAV